MDPESHDLVLEKAGKVGRNAVLLLAASFAAGVFGLAYTVLLARALGPESYGTYAGAIAWAMFAGLLVNSGPAYLITREVAQGVERESELVADITFGALAPLAASFAIAFVLAWRAPDAALRLAIPIAMVAVAARSVGRLYCAVFEGSENMAWTALSGVLQAVLPLAGLTLMLLPALRRPGVALGIEGTSLLLIAGGLFSALRHSYGVSLRRPPFRRLAALARSAWPFWAIVAASLIMLQCDMMLLSWSYSTRATGLYRSAMNFVSMAEIVPALLGVALYPMVSRHVNDLEVLRAVLWRSFKNSALLGIGVALAAATVAGPLIVLAYGEEFRDAGRLLILLAPVIALKYPLYILSLVLYAARKERRLLAGMFCAAALSIALNILLIPRYGPAGAAAASVVSNLVLLVWVVRLVVRHVASVAAWRLLPGILGGGAAYFGLVSFLPVNAWLRAAIGLLAYAAVLVLSGAIDALDLAGVCRTAHIRLPAALARPPERKR